MRNETKGTGTFQHDIIINCVRLTKPTASWILTTIHKTAQAAQFYVHPTYTLLFPFCNNFRQTALHSDNFFLLRYPYWFLVHTLHKYKNYNKNVFDRAIAKW